MADYIRNPDPFGQFLHQPADPFRGFDRFMAQTPGTAFHQLQFLGLSHRLQEALIRGMDESLREYGRAAYRASGLAQPEVQEPTDEAGNPLPWSEEG